MLFQKESYGQKISRNVRHYLPGNRQHRTLRKAGQYLPDIERYLPDLSDYTPDVSDTDMARGLGWASVAIGLAEIAAPKQVQDMLGLEDTPDCRGTLRVLGVREICHGVSILAEPKANDKMAVGVMSRIAGDLLDSALLGVAATKTKRPFSFAAITASVLAIGLADLITAKRLARRHL